MAEAVAALPKEAAAKPRLPRALPIPTNARSEQQMPLHGQTSAGSRTGIRTGSSSTEMQGSCRNTVQSEQGIPAAAVQGEARAAVEELLPDLSTVLRAGVQYVVLTLGRLGAALCSLR